jgi:ABC-type dipeptide/oligopeptide/nickel transport system permease component
MGRYVVRRMLYMVAVVIVVTLITFMLMHAVPGGPFSREKKLPDATIKILDERYHLDDPLWIQYVDYLYNTMIPHITTIAPSNSLMDDFMVNIRMGSVWFRWMNFGPSMHSRSRTVNDIFRANLPVSFQLGVLALLVALVLGMPLGILAALRQNTMYDYAGMAIAIFGVSVPIIVLAPVFVWLFGITLKWLPPTGWGAKPPFVLGLLPRSLGWNYFKFTIMPAVALGLGEAAIVARLTRASLLQTVREDYIRTARAKGLPERMVITRHAMKNSLIPVVTILGPLFAALVTGTFVAELIFGIPGMGKYFVTSITERDYPVIMGTIMLYAVLLVLANLVVDLTYAYLDPRIRYD